MRYKKGDTVYYIGAVSKYKDKPGVVKYINSDGVRVIFDGVLAYIASKSLLLIKTDYFKYLLDGDNK